MTLALDVGGTGIKAQSLDPSGTALGHEARLETEYPLPPERMIQVFQQLASQVPAFDRASVGFPGVVRSGLVISAPHFIRVGGDGTAVSPELQAAWNRFDLAEATERALGRPARIGNDAEVQGMAVVQGHGLEVVVTLGTGYGSAIFQGGRLAVHLELAHHPCHHGKTYNEYVGEAARRKVGTKRWNQRVRRTIELLRALLFFDHLYVGGGNSAHVNGTLPDDVTLVDNTAGLLGGIRLWEPGPRRG
ncbi:MAG: ROK family protein [Candidatus Dormibacteria bacterium]